MNANTCKHSNTRSHTEERARPSSLLAKTGGFSQILYKDSYQYALMTYSCVDVYHIVTMVIDCKVFLVLRVLEVFRRIPPPASSQQQWLSNDSRVKVC